MDHCRTNAGQNDEHQWQKQRHRVLRDEGKGADPIRCVFWIIFSGIENEGE
jgi:hypothetical protein